MKLRIGLDLDNTLICYDRAFCAAAAERGLVAQDFREAKPVLVTHIRRAHGEEAWQALQGYVYGAGIRQAELFPGVLSFLKRAKASGATLFIVSHKTEFGHFDPARVNLRDAAREFLRKAGVFAFVPEKNLFFCATRPEKLEKITALGCDVFIDDLAEVLTDPAFPPATRCFLFAPAEAASLPGCETVTNWQTLEEKLFDAH